MENQKLIYFIVKYCIYRNTIFTMEYTDYFEQYKPLIGKQTNIIIPNYILADGTHCLNYYIHGKCDCNCNKYIHISKETIDKIQKTNYKQYKIDKKIKKEEEQKEKDESQRKQEEHLRIIKEIEEKEKMEKERIRLEKEERKKIEEEQKRIKKEQEAALQKRIEEWRPKEEERIESIREKLSVTDLEIDDEDIKKFNQKIAMLVSANIFPDEIHEEKKTLEEILDDNPYLVGWVRKYYRRSLYICEDQDKGCDCPYQDDFGRYGTIDYNESKDIIIKYTPEDDTRTKFIGNERIYDYPNYKLEEQVEEDRNYIKTTYRNSKKNWGGYEYDYNLYRKDDCEVYDGIGYETAIFGRYYCPECFYKDSYGNKPCKHIPVENITVFEL